MSPSETSAIVVFAKAPIAGNVKTRLSSVLTLVDAAELYSCFLDDALSQYQQIAPIRLYVPATDKAYFEGRQMANQIYEQKGPDLGDRLSAATVGTFIDGFEKVVVVGSDHPTLPSSFIERAFSELDKPDKLVIGPSADGGYYLIGQNNFYPQIFEDITYSTSEVFSDTLERVDQLQDVALSILPEWYDVDDEPSLRQLIRDLDDRNCEFFPTRTFEMIGSFRTKYPNLFVQE